MVEKTALEQRGSTSFWSPEPVLIFAETASYKVKQPRCTRFFADLRLKIEAVYERHFKSFHMEATPLKTAKWTHLNRAVSLSWNVSISIRWKIRHQSARLKVSWENWTLDESKMGGTHTMLLLVPYPSEHQFEFIWRNQTVQTSFLLLA